MPPRVKPLILEVKGFHGGAQVVTDPDKLEPHMARKVENVVLDEIGMATVRLGTFSKGTIGAAGDRVLSAHVFQRAGQATQFIVHTSAGVLKRSTDLSTWTDIATGLSTTAPFSYVTFLDKVWMANGTNDYRSWDGTTQVTFASVAKFKYLEEWKDTLWGTGESTNPHRVYSSAAGDATTWPAINFVDVAKGQGPGNTGLASDQNALIVFKLHEHHAIYDPVEYTNRVVDSDKGCISHFSIIKHYGVIYFVSHQGICQYLGDSPAQIISAAIQPLFKLNVSSVANEAFWYAYSHNDRVGWCWPRDSTTDFFQVEYYPQLPDKPWVFHTIPVRVIVSVRDVATIHHLFGYGEGTNKVYEVYDSATFDDDGVPFTAVVETGWFDWEAPHIAKYLDRVLMLARGDFTLDILTDFDESTIVKTYTVDGPATLDEAEIFTDVYCRQIAFRVSTVAGGTTSHKFPVGAEVETVTEGKFAVGHLLAIAKPLGPDR